MSRKTKKSSLMKTLYLFLVALFLVACSSENKLESEKQEMMDADRAFSAMSQELGMNKAFESYCAEDAVLVRSGSFPIEGKEAIKEELAKNDDSAFTLTWEPTQGRIASSGDMGFTYGNYTMAVKGSGQVLNGTYVSIWVKENGKWKWALDTGNEGNE
jgi:ketosteroid isomerase-like protein